MPDITLAAERDRTTGSRASRRLRASGRVPAVVYGHGSEPLALSVNARELRVALSGPAGTHALVNLDVAGEPHLVMARDLQRHAVRGDVVHVDFQVVGRHEELLVEVPIRLVGEPEAVRLGGAVLDQQLFALSVRAAADSVPDAIEVDISALEMGAAIRVGDLRLPARVRADADGDQTVVAVEPPRAEEGAGEPGEAEG